MLWFCYIKSCLVICSFFYYINYYTELWTVGKLQLWTFLFSIFSKPHPTNISDTSYLPKTFHLLDDSELEGSYKSATGDPSSPSTDSLQASGNTSEDANLLTR